VKILLTGSTGQVGWELARTLSPIGEVIEVNRHQIDIADLQGLHLAIKSYRPDVIVNPAAYTAVDKAESEQEMAFLINGRAPEVMAEAAKEQNALLIHYSTDYVFDGTKDTPYSEEDKTNPVNIYGASKLAGEAAIRAIDCDYLILRTSWVYTNRGNNFLKTILRLATEREELNIVADQIGSPTWSRLIAEVTAHMVWQTIRRKQVGEFQSGTYHLTSTGETSWHGFAEKIVNLAREQAQLTIKNQRINPIPTSGYPVPAKRPANSRLNCHKLEQEFNLALPSWENSLNLCMQSN
jgi:dTDP-4-dehydrorhamnose reductase